jgi:hypothetical protein
MKMFEFVWTDGKVERAAGITAAQAFASLGYTMMDFKSIECYSVINSEEKVVRKGGVRNVEFRFIKASVKDGKVVLNPNGLGIFVEKHSDTPLLVVKKRSSECAPDGYVELAIEPYCDYTKNETYEGISFCAFYDNIDRAREAVTGIGYNGKLLVQFMDLYNNRPIQMVFPATKTISGILET